MSVDALVITCMDAPLHRADKAALAEHLRGKRVGIKTWDLLSTPGGARDFVALDPVRSPASNGADAGTRKDALLYAVKLAHDAHGVSKVFLVNHSACVAYGSAGHFGDATVEYRKHAEDLRAARETLRQFLPNLDVRLFFATVEERADGPFVTIDEVR